MGDDIKLTDLISVETLQLIQDSFCGICNIAIGISDENGVNVTKDTLPSDFCLNYNKKSPIGRARCEECDRRGGEMALKQGRSVIYNCHAGLVDFAAPIIAHGKMVGSITGGQVRTDELDEEWLRETAVEIGVDPDGYVKAAKKIRYIDEEELERDTKFLYQMSTIISNMAYDRYALIKANEEVEHAAQMKSDFLANMSHEIRTPMNAVIGMAEMALREDLPKEAREYIGQIISSGKTLLTIINDILDFSKIDAGKMTMEEEEYEMMSLVNDVSNIINTRIGDKDIELILDIDPKMPRVIKGDINRLKQVIINLSNNAVKFTKEGQVVLKVSFQKKSQDEILLMVAVQDTGIGIKKEDVKRLFEAFQQVDSKRNRNIEGTGLGLAISKRIINLMGGDIWVESEYGKGSLFSFAIPQKIVDETPSVSIANKEKLKVAVLVANGFLKKHLEKDMWQLGIDYVSLDSEDEIDKLEDVSYLFVGQGMFSEKVSEYVHDHPDMKTILMIDFRNDAKSNMSNLLVVRKPVYVLNIASLLKGEDINEKFGCSGMDDFDFVAPEAEILIVDDNVINLTVAEGLLKPLQMKIEKATSGKQAVEMISAKKYDLVFMDHMMPEMDGVETTRVIRRFHPEYEKLPIIALTANAVSGTKEMFIEEGMNDFIAKPIEMRTMLAKLRTWLPKDKIMKVSNSNGFAKEEKKAIVIQGLDTEEAMKLLGSEELYFKVLKDYYQVIEKKSAIIYEAVKNQDWERYTIEVHALKSASRQVGAMELSKMAARLEQAGNERDVELINTSTDEMLTKYIEYKHILEPYFEKDKDNEAGTTKQPITNEVLMQYFADIEEALSDLDMDKVEEIIEEMSAYSYEDDYFSELKDAVMEYDADKCEDIIKRWKQ